MSHLAPLISDLALILITAGVVTIIFKWLKQPVVLGYIVAGFLISPHFYLLPSVADPENITIWADIGIIFLLFALGLEFSFKKLLAVGGKASIATLINMGSMIAIGFLIGQLLNWTTMESIFLGGMLSMSSTTIIIKAFNDMGLQKKKFAGIVFGMLVVEDLAAILMMVLLSTVAVSQHFEGAELFDNVLRLIFFIVIWFVVGIYLIPLLLKKFKRFLNDEMLLVVSVGLCLGMVLFANSVGFSAALGAFIMGSILAETIESKRIEHLIEPLKNLFGAVFFVSVGMMLVPEILVEYIGIILILTAVVLVGRVIFATLGVLASGEGLKVSMQAGFSLAQIGEFSFIIAALGMQLGVISDFIYPIIVTVSIITTFTTPYFIRFADPIYNKLEKHIPKKWNKLLTGYSVSKDKYVNKQSDWNKVLKNVLLTVTVYFILALAMYLISDKFISPFIIAKIPNIWGSLLAAIIALIIMGPFLVGIIMPRKKIRKESRRLWRDKRFYKGFLVSLSLLRFTLCIILILMVLVPLFPKATGLLILISVFVLIVLVFFEGYRKHPAKMELQFFKNLKEKERLEERSKPITKRFKEDLLDKNIHVEEIEIPQNAPIIGKTLSELNFKQKTGINIISIIRGMEKINIPDGNERIYPYDKIIVAGSDEELQKIIQLIEERKNQNKITTSYHQITLSQYVIERNSPLIEKTINDLKIREKTNCMILGIERNSEIIQEIDGKTMLQYGDVLWLAGENSYLSNFEKNMMNENDF